MKQFLTPALLVLALFLIAFIFIPRHDIPAPIERGDFTVTLSVSVETLLGSMNRLDADKRELVPADGLIFPPTVLQAMDGDTAFEILRRTMRENEIHIEFRYTPVLDSAYVRGINNIYEFDAGPLSGWLYRVNGEFASVGASQLELQDGDVVEWLFTLDLGRDVGADVE